ncbi:multicopper oxidase family protein [Microbacterium sediminicola]|uniref:Multicopper oxidase family protein n=1 Tax=Microbacterium sediminicola TaxID=415210 RepID=A0ABN2IJU9_9MICO
MGEGITRRQALTIGGVGAGVVVIVGAGLATSGLGGSQDSGATSTPQPDPTVARSSSGDAAVAWVEPAVLTSAGGILEIDLDVAESEVVVGGATQRMLTFNGTVPGPTLHLHPGDRLLVHLHNGLGEATNLHTHGLLVSASGNSDNPFVHIEPGESFDYEIVLPDDHPAGVCWYHPHHHGMVADQLFGGLYGAILVDEDDWTDAAPRVAVVSDVTFSGGAVAEVTNAERRVGRTGDVLLVNGQPRPELRAPTGSEQRLVIVNACASRYLDLQLAGLYARLLGIDTGHVDEAVTTLFLVPGNRADVVLTMPDSSASVTTAAYERAQGGMGGGMMGGASTLSPETLVLTLTPDSAAPAPSVLPSTTTNPPDLRSATLDGSRTLTMSMGMGGGAGMQFLIDGAEFDPDRIDQSVALGAVEEWTIRNVSPMDHPFHLHIWPMQVQSVGGVATRGMDVRDVVNVAPNSEVVVRLFFDRFPGKTLYHCHILDHEDLGMMGVIEAS